MAIAAETGRVILRPPVPEDVRELAVLEQRSFPDPWPAGVFLAELGAPARFHRVLVTPEGQLVAYLFSAWQYLDLHVLNIATDPLYRRQGYARLLLDAARRHAAARGGESVTLEVRSGNTPAIELYSSLGYRKVGIRRRYYGDGEDAIIMTLPLRETAGTV